MAKMKNIQKSMSIILNFIKSLYKRYYEQYDHHSDQYPKSNFLPINFSHYTKLFIQYIKLIYCQSELAPLSIGNENWFRPVKNVKSCIMIG
jgi:hypothetical protein